MCIERRADVVVFLSVDVGDRVITLLEPSLSPPSRKKIVFVIFFFFNY